MNRRKVDSQRERRLLIAMITSTPFLTQSAKAMELDLIQTAHMKQIATWCVEYFTEYGQAPGSHIEDLYHKWSEDNENTELVSSVSDFLNSLSKEYDEADSLNVPFLLDELGQWMSKLKMVRVQEDMTYSLLHGKVREAEASLLAYRSVKIGESIGFDPLRDDDVWSAAFSAQAQPIIHFPGDAGKFFNWALTRDALVAIQAPEKTGKTMWLLEFVMRGLMERNKVALFEVGDLSKSEILLRMGMRWAKRPLWKSQCGSINYPYKVELDEAEEAGYRLYHRAEKIRNAVSEGSVKRGRRKFEKSFGLSGGSFLRVSVHPNSSINVQGIDGVLTQWEAEDGFIPDMIVIDYADILAPEETKGRKHEHDRNVTNDTWMAMKRLSQTRHALVLTATQSNAQAYGQDVILQTMKHFSEDKRKYAHVNGTFALNRTPEESEIQGMRLNWIVLRGAPYNSNRALYVGTCYALARAMCVARMG